MEKEIKHRLKRSRRRERAERMQAQRDHGDSAEDETLSGVKPHRPPIRRKKAKEPIFEEDIIDGFAILAFRSYEELEMAVKMATTKNSKYNMLGEEKMRNQGNLRIINRHSPAPGHDAGTSDDSGRASEVRPSGLPHGHRESSHDRLSDASSRCSSERGYICDSEGEDDKGSDAGSLFAATPTSTPRKNEMTDSGGTRSALLTNGLSSPPRTGVRSGVSSSAPVPPLQPNGLTESSRNSVGITLPNFQSSHLGKSLEGENASTKPRLENLALNSNDKSRAEMNCQALDKRLESNTHIESKRLDANTHQHMIGNFDKRLDGHFNHLDKGRIEGVHHEKNSLDKSRLDSVRLEKTRVDVLPVHVLENAPVPSHLDKRTLDNAPGQVDKCLENSVHAPVSLDKRKDSHSSVVMDKGRMERDVSLAHAPVSSPTHGTAIPNSGPPASHVHSPALPNNPPHQQAAHPGGNTLPHKPIHSSHIYQNSIKTHLHNPGLPSHNGTTLQFPPKRPLILHNPILSPSIRPLNTPTTSSVPPTTSASPVISNSNAMSTTGSISNSGIPNLSTTLSLSNTGESSNDSPGIFQHSTLHSVNHLSNQPRSSNDSVLPPCPGNSPQPGGVSLRTSSDSNQNITQANTPSSAQHPTLASNQSTSHTASHVLGTSPSAISTASLTPATSTNSNVAVSLPSHLELPVTSAVNSHPALSLHANAPSNGSLINHAGVQGSGNSAIHSGYPLSLPGAPYTGYPPLYGPYSSNLQHSPYIPPRIEPPVSNMGSPISKQQPSLNVNISSSSCTAPVVTTSTTTSHRDIITTPAVSRSQSPRGHSPTRERDSYSSNVSSLSRGSTTPVNGAPSASPFSSAPSSSLNNPSPYVKNPVWVSTPGPGPTRPSLHPSNFPPPMFAPPLPPPAAPSGPAPFSAESLFQTNQADLLRRELDNRFLASQERTLGVVPAFLRTEMHHHQHQHTHVHQHQAPALYPPPLFKDIPKLGGVDSPFYRGNLGLASYPGFSPGLLGPGLPSTPFAPPSHLPTFTPKQVGDASKPRIVKTGKWNAMHVRVAWEIYHHQQKQTAEGKSGLGGSSSKDTLLRPSGHLFPSTGTSHDLARYPAGFLPPPPHIGSTVTPFGRYPPMGSFGPPPASFPGITGFPSREISSLAPLPTVHDPWRLRAPSAFPVGPSPWSLKPEPAAVDRREFEEREREREREKERIRREREERERDRERREREEKRKIELERERREKERRELERRELERFNKVRDRSPIRNGDIKEEPRPVKEEDIVILGRTGPGGPYPPHSYGIGRHPSLRPPPLTPHFAPSAWPPPPGADPYAYRLDPLLRYNPLVPYRQEEEEQRAKLYGVGGFLPPHAPHHQSSSPVLMKKEESQSR